MTTLTLNAVGLTADLSPSGDRAFRYALSLARTYGLQLNVFAFLDNPFEPDPTVSELTPEEREKRIIAADRKLRLHYEDRLGDFVDVGFKVCEGREGEELRRCLKRREYQLLVIPYRDHGMPFGDMPVEQFASRFLSPVVLVGPWRKVRYYLNAQAVHLKDKLHLYEGTWRAIPTIDTRCEI
ncbi:MAG: universal stress protein [Planctomycetota bacterium]